MVCNDVKMGVYSWTWPKSMRTAGFIISRHMKIALSSIVALLIIAAVTLAQRPDKKTGNVADTIEYIKRETIGGKLDFTSVLKEPGFLPIDYNGVRFNRNDYHVFLWGQAVSDLGVESTDEAARLWEDIHQKKLSSPQRTALKIGFEKKLK
jgi:hypothetical protein